MTPIQHLRAAAEAARAALAAVEADQTATNSEIDRARRTFRAAHQRWLDDALDRLTGAGVDEIAEAAA